MFGTMFFGLKFEFNFLLWYKGKACCVQSLTSGLGCYAFCLTKQMWNLSWEVGFGFLLCGLYSGRPWAPSVPFLSASVTWAGFRAPSTTLHSGGGWSELVLGAPSHTLKPFKTPALPGFPCYCCSLVGSNGSLNAADGEDRKVELVCVCVGFCLFRIFCESSQDSAFDWIPLANVWCHYGITGLL